MLKSLRPGILVLFLYHSDVYSVCKNLAIFLMKFCYTKWSFSFIWFPPFIVVMCGARDEPQISAYARQAL